ncbi:Dam family site-specific DNA-(adenine-N6)-methyltransferase [Mesorhizobium sp. M7A.F.Ca.US.011.01.1.1]|uniref:DNA adenine methylase n=1 Tax=Mesorhizobium sp. M7A.F.Ca.US.011.01.1.1 TaxID=2496741 RepID=UPI000FCB3D1E|nr:Dam family site-specific DNA-(adenine-N6)-methyltransferase [Mesorhizobium sp. M7A.F.Ca.US.011.01.1.1]RUX22018.1 Dam family site-specific DNA-(adenine-N6)-methyltransferase [Mesorhizobium sp. M7A.F.Ca.US.011.01.1.1]
MIEAVSEQTIITNEVAAAKPFLRWAGSKRSVVKKLAENSPPEFSRYLEPFVGSGALYFHLNPKDALLSDLNWEVVNLFNQVKNRPTELHERLVVPNREKETYLAIRQRFGTEPDELDQAASMLYLNRNCFNGLFRTNKSGKFNVPFASQRRGSYPTCQDLIACSERLKTTLIEHGDFYSVISSNVREGDFVYLDPPYVKSEGRIFNEYVKGHFNHQDTERLAVLLKNIDAAGAKFLLSFIDDAIVDFIAAEWGSQKYLERDEFRLGIACLCEVISAFG